MGGGCPVAAARSLGLLTLPDEDHGTSGPGDHALGDGADEEPGEAAEAARTQHQQVGPLGGLQQGRGSRAVDLLAGDEHVGYDTAHTLHRLPQGAGRRLPLRGVRGLAAVSARVPVPDVHQSQRPVTTQCLAGGPLRGGEALGRSVHSGDDGRQHDAHLLCWICSLPPASSRGDLCCDAGRRRR
ncbi:hypothetical protein AQJ30_34215 [Streptomyces longwoodensis]|uniref:Uncharacterized protein n=1 Tax=Streptomyces longwoodensis TaxID=68231 RepID=A0A101QNQ9_9ACTN|nr:hypothetical protein AQJ30_34215 [Streptomyces longwoodensis]